MLRTILFSVLTLALVTATADGAKAKKKESEVQKALKERYPDAQTEITTTTEVNGVKVYDVKITTPQGESTAQITDYGDFLMYGKPHEFGAIRSAISNKVSGLFTARPEAIEMYRVTYYDVDFKAQDGKTYTGRFDAVGRLKDIQNADEIARESGEQARGEQVKDEAAVQKATQYVKRELPEAEVEAVYKGNQGEGFWYVQTKGGGDVIVNEQGQVYSLREPIPNEEFPEPIAASIKTIFTAPIEKLWRGEHEYYQFTQQSQRGQPIVVQMRPNGDILEVRNMEAIEDEARQAGAKEKAD